MLDLAVSPHVRSLTQEDLANYERDGFLKNLPVFAPEGVEALQALYRDFVTRMPADVDISRVNSWQKCSRIFRELSRTPTILDYVEAVTGPNFFQWSGQFFVKNPGDGSQVPWHQDAQYWPLTPRKTVTVWLAIFDTDEENAAMKVMRGSHREGEFAHHVNKAPHLVLEQEVDDSIVDPSRVVTMDLKAGEISLHDDGLLHGSGANHSDRPRAGLTMRFCPTDVKCDLSVWPNFEAYMVRGVDEFNLNPVGLEPQGEFYPVRKFQHSSEFVPGTA